MALLFENVYMDLITIAAGVIGVIVWYLNNNFNYWKKRGVFYLQPESFFGNVRDATLVKKPLGKVMENLYHELGNQKFGGVFLHRTPVLLIKDPDVIKTIIVKDFSYFQDRNIDKNMNVNPVSENLFFMGGSKWRWLRTKLTPTFTSGKMKMMYHLIDECSSQLTQYVAQYADTNEILELREVLAKFTTDVIGTCAFGLKCNAMTDPNSEFRKKGKEIMDFTFKKILMQLFIDVFPKISQLMRMHTLDKDSSDFFLRVVRETIEYRTKNNITRNDFLQLLIELWKNEKLQDDQEANGKADKNSEKGRNGHASENDFELTDELLTAQVLVFFLAGFETSSSAMSCALYEMALNPDIQTCLRNEVDSVLQECNGEVSYEAILQMEYLDKVVSETLRKYPPVPLLNRQCTTSYTIPDTGIKLEKGVDLIIPALALHFDPKYFPDPEKFDPERFSAENKAKRHHYVYLPFGEGPRNCIGMRFGLLQTKKGLFSLLSKYEFSVCEKTLIPLHYDPREFITSTRHGTTLRISHRK